MYVYKISSRVFKDTIIRKEVEEGWKARGEVLEGGINTDQTNSENTHNRLADISPGAGAISQDNSQSQASIKNYYFSNFKSNNVWEGQTRKSAGDILKASGVKADQDQDQL